MKKVSFQVGSYSHLVIEINGISYNVSCHSMPENFWREEDDEGNPNLCTEVPDAPGDIPGIFNDGQNNYPLTSYDFVGGRPVGR